MSMPSKPPSVVLSRVRNLTRTPTPSTEPILPIQKGPEEPKALSRFLGEALRSVKSTNPWNWAAHYVEKDRFWEVCGWPVLSRDTRTRLLVFRPEEIDLTRLLLAVDDLRDFSYLAPGILRVEGTADNDPFTLLLMAELDGIEVVQTHFPWMTQTFRDLQRTLREAGA